jgi:phosphopantothenoylcysteine synthetase/decarboxylase
MPRFSCLITAGPTREYLDPVRYISNASSGKMGYALAAEAAKRGWNVVLVSGPVQEKAPSGIKIVNVVSALDMLGAVKKYFPKADAMIGAAAVADWRPAGFSCSKLKKSKTAPVIRLALNPDILKEAGRLKTKQIMVGFALETDDVAASAQKKLAEKNLDMVVANEPFVIGKNSAKVMLIDACGKQQSFSGTKKHIAKRILDAVHKKARHI